MQLLDSTMSSFGHPLIQDTERLQTTLADIVSQVKIEAAHFRICHPSYQPLELPPESIERFRTLPNDLRQKYLSLQLRSFLYGIYYSGSLQAALALDAKTDSRGLAPDLENNTFLGMDLEFYQQLHDSNAGQGYFDPGWLVLREESDRSFAVKKGGLTLHIKPAEHLKSADAPAIGETVAIRLPKNLVQNGFYMAVGDAGPQRAQSEQGTAIPTVRIYWHLNPAGAIAVMGSLTQSLNQLGLPFSFKVLYNPGDYTRYDSGVMYFGQPDYPAIKPVLTQVYAQHQAEFGPHTPLFTKTLAIGLGLAEEPDQKFASQESFGMNRCQIIANGLLVAQQQGDESPQARQAAIQQQFTLVGIDLERPYLNADSSDIY